MNTQLFLPILSALGSFGIGNNHNFLSPEVDTETVTDIRIFGIDAIKASTFGNQEHSDYVSLIINGYIRHLIKYAIAGINQLCQKYYDDFPTQVIYFCENNNWFKSIRNKYEVFKQTFEFRCKPVIQVLTQFIDETYQIIFVAIPDCHIRMAWQGFMCINTKTLDIHLISWEAEKFNWKKIHLLISEPLQLSEFIPSNYFGANLQWFKPKNEQSKTLKFSRWKTFDNNLWNLLMEYNANTSRQEQVNYIYKHVWDIIKFYFVIKHGGQQCKHNVSTQFTTPYIGWMPGWNTPDIKYDEDIKSKFKYYNQGNGLRLPSFAVECHLFVDWGGGYSYSGGYNQCLYKCEFEMHKKKDKVAIEFTFMCVKSCTKYGTPLR